MNHWQQDQSAMIPHPHCLDDNCVIRPGDDFGLCDLEVLEHAFDGRDVPKTESAIQTNARNLAAHTVLGPGLARRKIRDAILEAEVK